MKLKLSIPALIVVLFGLMFACAEDPLYVVPIEFKSAQDVFSDSLLAESFINNAYTEMPANCHASFNRMDGNAMLASACDEAMHNATNKTSPSAPSRMSAGNWGPSNMRFYRESDGAGEIGSWMKWGGYHGMRKCNTALKNVHFLPATSSQRFRNRIKGEAYFLRGIQHWFLFQKWGGIPIVDKSFEASDNVLLPRNSVEQVVNFIVRQCDEAFALLPDKPYDQPYEVGRADRGTCLALKSRVLLYAASPLYNGPGFNGSKDSLICYGQYDPNRWVTAAKAAQDFIDLKNFHYELYTVPARSKDPQQHNAYHLLFNAWGAGNTNSELIFACLRGANRDTENDNFIGGLTNGKGGTCPSQDLVDAYEMKDGTRFDWNNPAHAADPYKDRDPRFYASIIYNGETFATFANKSNYTIQTYIGGANATGNAATGTSYYLYKFLDYHNTKPDAGSGSAYHNWMYFRYAEILLNLAEAGNEAGGPSYTVPEAVNPITPVQALNLVRARAGMPSVEETFQNRGIALDKDNLRQFIYNERRIELAFEEHRYYDVRRWMIVAQLPRYIRGCRITRTGNTYTYDPTYIAENKVFESKHYFFPIPQVEMNRNPNMRQNPGW